MSSSSTPKVKERDIVSLWFVQRADFCSQEEATGGHGLIYSRRGRGGGVYNDSDRVVVLVAQDPSLDGGFCDQRD